MGSTVLVVEDETKLRVLVRTYLEREGLTVMTAATGAEAVSLGARHPPDLVVLDLGLPDISGEEVCTALREAGDPLVLILTARAGEEDRIRGFEIGADDYLTKPFSLREMCLRVLAMLRRVHDVRPGSVLSFGRGELVIDEERHEVRRHGEPVGLSPTEWGVLIALARVPGRVYSRAELVNAVRGYEWEGYDRVMDSHVKNLRRKLADHGDCPRLIETVVGAGYRLGLVRDAG